MSPLPYALLRMTWLGALAALRAARHAGTWFSGELWASISLR
ncbi:hypothetical protein [Blastococcus sp. VKM Ac-2987]|nr:hypothetical protein [Blastococcus sp. VKM Ac-2987]MCZ2860794.1 hypothetical protein [Blastococcus sp. VKM Ac-2987]